MRLLALVLAALLLGGCVGAAVDSAAPVDQLRPGAWTTLATMPSERQEVAVAAFQGRVWVIGGLGSGAAPVPTVEAYDPAANLWEERTPLPVGLHHAAAAVVDGRLFVIGGYSGGRLRWIPEATVYEYDGRTHRWALRAPMPTARGALAAAALRGRIHAVGGTGEAVTGAHEVYDPATDRWTAANPMPTPRDHLAAVAFQDRLWTLGGRASFLGVQHDSVEVYDPTTDSWRTAPPLPAARGGLAAAALEDRLVVLGGEAPFRIYAAVDVYEAAARRWVGKAPMPTPRHGIGAVVIGDRVFVPAGGTRPGYAPTGANEAYRP